MKTPVQEIIDLLSIDDDLFNAKTPYLIDILKEVYLAKEKRYRSSPKLKEYDRNKTKARVLFKLVCTGASSVQRGDREGVSTITA